MGNVGCRIGEGGVYMAVKRAKRPSMKQYLIMFSLLYGEFTWYERHPDGSITIPVRKMCSHFRTRPPDLREMLVKLYGIGALEQVKWHSHWVVVKPRVPVSMERHVAEVLDIGEPIYGEDNGPMAETKA